ncbi:MAG: hypothetical protein COA36_08375 [Desulfotalea sp.]|nr:MAG: hypothetical protein COA36_08375 [Desulfotalea sp.]
MCRWPISWPIFCKNWDYILLFAVYVVRLDIQDGPMVLLVELWIFILKERRGCFFVPRKYADKTRNYNLKSSVSSTINARDDAETITAPVAWAFR